MAEVSLKELRNIVYGCLKELKLDNAVQLRKIGFSDLARATARVVVIKGWNSSMDGHKWSSLVKMIYERTRELYEGIPGWRLIVEAE